MLPFAPTPAPPYYAVIFSSLRTEGDQGYGEMAVLMDEMARQQPGYLGIESARDELGITVSYWRDEESIRGWKAQLDHLQAQRQGRAQWYSAYQVRVCKVERAYGFTSDKLI
ncbi:antibiotic biosynthesis monooxygenase family protein [Hymenobacter actinosclerus]|uniref:Heme-degrading monooxygenase HmoA n=1 Tax=Hymenobacter actinosclerus TaxID=82805 RepID=A0A1H9ZFD3_9BACT|nr:antibiotic biosynthesis monooxygenase [Hymenobacter actinosclerus]SES80360.1 Heme-degrading monooxygenase HmoA [Hymenobacter actinosclerus]